MSSSCSGDAPYDVPPPPPIDDDDPLSRSARRPGYCRSCRPSCCPNRRCLKDVVARMLRAVLV